MRRAHRCRVLAHADALAEAEYIARPKPEALLPLVGLDGHEALVRGVDTVRQPPQLHNFDALAGPRPRRNRVLWWRRQQVVAMALGGPRRHLLFPGAAAAAPRPDAIGVLCRKVQDLGLHLVNNDAIVVGEVTEGGSGGYVAAQDQMFVRPPGVFPGQSLSGAYQREITRLVDGAHIAGQGNGDRKKSKGWW